MTRRDGLLVAGAVAGLALGVAGLSERRTARVVPDGAIALVGGSAIARAEFERAVAAVAADRRNVVDAAVRRRVLDRLIDEELLVQRGLELELARTDPSLRAATSAAVIDLVVARGRAGPDVGDAALRAFYDDNRDYFRAPETVHLRELCFTGESSRVRAVEARDRIVAGDAIDVVAATADRAPVALPTGPITARKLRDYLGARARALVRALSPGQVTEPLAHGRGHRLLVLVARTPGAARAFDAVRELVRREYHRRQGEQRLREFLDRRRRAARITLAGDAP